VLFAGLALLILSLSRLGLAEIYRERLPVAGGLLPLLGMGLRFDVVVVAGLCSVPLITHLLAPGRLLLTAGWRSLRTAWFSTWMLILTFNEAATPDFMAEFGVRPNRQYVEYLDTPGVVFSTIWSGNRASLLSGIGAAALAAFITRWLLRRAPRGRDAPTLWARPASPARGGWLRGPRQCRSSPA
jgi:hypothetical protein